MLKLSNDDPLAIAAVAAIRAGDVATLTQLVADHPDLATARLAGPCRNSGENSRTLLHTATDWPGHFPNVVETVKVLLAAGCDVNGHCAGPHTETPLHWAASSDDVAVLDLLLDHGADIEAEGSVIGGGTPIADAAAFGQWNAARRLVERGANTNLWQSAALGLMDRVKTHFSGDCSPSYEELNNALWCASHGGQREAAEFMLDHGAFLNWIGHDRLTPLDAARRSEAHALADWLIARGAKTAKEMNT